MILLDIWYDGVINQQTLLGGPDPVGPGGGIEMPVVAQDLGKPMTFGENLPEESMTF